MVAEFTERVGGSRVKEDKILGVEVLLVSTPHFPLWELYADGAAN